MEKAANLRQNCPRMAIHNFAILILDILNKKDCKLDKI